MYLRNEKVIYSILIDIFNDDRSDSDISTLQSNSI